MSGCDARHPEAATDCDGPPDTIVITDRTGERILGCRHHATILYAALGGFARIGLGPSGHGLVAIEVFQRAQVLLDS